MKEFYMSLRPNNFSLTNMKTNETFRFETLKELLAVALKSSCKVYLFELTPFSRAIVNNLFNDGYKEISTCDMNNAVKGKINPKEFVVLGGEDIITIRCRRTTKAQTIFHNASGLFGAKATIKDIVASVGEEDEVAGMVKALNILHENGFTGLTASVNAFNDLKKRCFANRYGDFVDKNFRETFPSLEEEVHDYVMQSFQGGLCIYNDAFLGATDVVGRAYDVNSMFPSVMMQELLPCGEAAYFKGKYVPQAKSKYMDASILYFQRVKIGQMSVKENKFPVIKSQMDEGLRRALGFKDYITNAKNVELILNHVDLEILFDNYNVTDIVYIDGYSFDMFKGEDVFGDYINHWMQMKVAAPKNSFERDLAKQMLNSAYGKFVTKTKRDSYGYCLDIRTGEYVRSKGYFKSKTNAVYAPVGAYITSYARKRLLDAINANRDNFIYSDTDSIYVQGVAKGIDVHENDLGKWKEEFEFNKINVVGKKQYCVQKVDGTVKAVLAGIDDKIVAENIKEYNDFYIGKKLDGFRDNYNLYGERRDTYVRFIIQEGDGDPMTNEFSFVEYMRARIRNNSVLGKEITYKGQIFVVLGE